MIAAMLRGLIQRGVPDPELFLRLDSYCETILTSLRPLCQDSFIYSKLLETLDIYQTNLKNSINAFINQLFDTAAVINKEQLERVRIRDGLVTLILEEELRITFETPAVMFASDIR